MVKPKAMCCSTIATCRSRQRRDRHEIVKGVASRLKRGEVLGLIGESGAGKSTIGLAAMGFARAGCRITAGSRSSSTASISIAASDEERRKLRGSRIAYVAQSAAAAFNPAHRIIDQTVETAVQPRHREPRARPRPTPCDLYARAASCPIPNRFGDRYPHQVSGGQLQRAMTAMAMSCRPDLIIFDEPTTALDVTTQVEVLAAIRDIVEQFNTAAIYITHDLAVVAQMAHRIMVLRYGKLVEEAPTREMLKSPREDYTKTLWAVRKLPRKRARPPERRRRCCASRTSMRRLWRPGQGARRRHGPRAARPHVAVVGESGSGKSTLARAITGLLPPIQGEIYFDGKPLPRALKERDKDTLRRIQMIYQIGRHRAQSAPDGARHHRPAARILSRPARAGRATRAGRRAARADRARPTDFIDRLPGELSGGQKQRICIARALAAEPELIICDEVTSALDQIVQEEILKLLLRLQEETDVSYLFITHDIATVRRSPTRSWSCSRAGWCSRADAAGLSPAASLYRAACSSRAGDGPGWLDRPARCARYRGPTNFRGSLRHQGCPCLLIYVRSSTIENFWITAGRRHPACRRIWLPADAERQAGAGDPRIYPLSQARRHAGARRTDARLCGGHGYAAVRVDLRGSGDSDGVLQRRISEAGA